MEVANVINLRLLAHPVNWLIVWIILALATMAYGLVHDAVGAHSADSSISPD